MPSLKIGPFYFGDNPPILPVLTKWIKTRQPPITIAEIGPGRGTIGAALRSRLGSHINDYFGIERDTHVEGPYTRLDDVSWLPGGLDLVIASEVIEHMPMDAFFENMMPLLMQRMKPDASIIIGTPNAMAPASIFGDFTHVQGYAWYDLYALLRLYLRNVEIFRTRYVWSLARLMNLLPRMLVSKALELDWCEGLIAIGSRPYGNQLQGQSR